MNAVAEEQRPPGKPLTQMERIAALYNQKTRALAEASADREGRPYGTTEVDIKKLAEMWEERDPAAPPEEKVWDDLISKAAAALQLDQTLDRDDVLAEIPIMVADIIYPRRREVIKAMGGDDYTTWVANAAKVEAEAVKLREAKAQQKPDERSDELLAEGVPEPALEQNAAMAPMSQTAAPIEAPSALTVPAAASPGPMPLPSQGQVEPNVPGSMPIAAPGPDGTGVSVMPAPGANLGPVPPPAPPVPIISMVPPGVVPAPPGRRI